MKFTLKLGPMDPFQFEKTEVKRLKSKRLTTGEVIKELLCAGDAATMGHSGIELQRLVDRLGEACDLFGMTISVKGQTHHQR